jgi:HlyD family secretion protein
MKLRRSGFATLTQEQTVREKLMAAAQDHDQANANVLQVDTQRQALVNQRDEALRGVNERLINARNSLASIEELLRVGKDVRAPVSGRIIQFESQLHTFVSPGTTVALIEFGREQSSAIAYVPAIDGKLITPGMRVEVSPTTTKPEQYGSIVGTVQSVGAYPATSADMMRVLNNQTLVNTFLAGGAPLEVLVSLHQDPSTVSGLEWTSVGGPPLKITGGTIASARITVENDPPITLVVPFFRRFLGI